jgi:hypothetical protein
MPKIVINEYDLSKAGTVPYENFSVVVPGFLADDKYVEVEGEDGTKHYALSEEAQAVFDENGVYECSSQLDFENNVGKKAATFTSFTQTATPQAPIVNTVLKLNPDLYEEAEGFDATNEVLVETTEGDNPVTTISYLKAEAFTKAYNAALRGVLPTAAVPAPEDDAEAAEGAPSFKVYYAEKATNRNVGRLKTKTRNYIEVVASVDEGVVVYAGDEAEDGTLELEVGASAPEYTEYFIIYDDTEEVSYTGITGSYVEDNVVHYGNQMAYELLGLGYTVLFKAMMPHTKDELAKLADEVEENLVWEEVEVSDGDGTKKEKQAVVNESGAMTLNATATAAAGINDGNFWECLKDKSTYDFRYLVTGLLTNNDQANKCILEIADHSEEILLDDASIQDGRGDCIALIDLDSATYEGKTQKDAIPAMANEAAEWASAYAAVFAPYVTYLMSDDPVYKNKTFPASFHYLACAANSSNNNFSEWYANAGYTRGVAKYTIESTGCKFGEAAIQALEPRFMLKVGKELNEEKTAWIDINTVVAINLIVKIKSSYYLWGNRTGKKLGTRGAADGDLKAQDFLNIRQLCCTIKKQVYTTCRRLTFDPNSNNLWINFRSLLTPMLEEMKADQGIKDYKFVKNDTDRKALLSAKIRIVPIEAVEDFEIGLYLEDTLDEVALTEA